MQIADSPVVRSTERNELSNKAVCPQPQPIKDSRTGAKVKAGPRHQSPQRFDQSMHAFYAPIGKILNRPMPHIDLVRAASLHRLKTDETIDLFK